MVTFTKLEENFLPDDGDWLRVTGTIGEEDIEKINSLPRKTVLVIDNTKGLSSELMSKITSDNITFSVLGGLDFFNKEKYKKANYIERTLVSPTGLREIIRYFEEIESFINPEWTDTQKCMFLYDAIVKDFIYKEDYKTKIGKGVAERGLNGVLYKMLVCAGFAQVFKEGLDRLGIENVYQNRKGHHSWNIVNLEGKWRGLEITWDCYNKGEDNICQFRYFGQDEKFYQNTHHALSRVVEETDWDFDTVKKTTIYEEETEYDLTPFTVEELKSHFAVIAPTVVKRKVNSTPLFRDEVEEIHMLPIDRLRLYYDKKCTHERNYCMLYEFLKASGQLKDDQYEFLTVRTPFRSDVLGSAHYHSYFDGGDVGIESLRGSKFYTHGDYEAHFGTKLTVAGTLFKDEVKDEEAKLDAFKEMRRILEDYSVSFLTETFNSLETILSRYEQIRNLQVEKDLNLALKEADLYSQLRSLIKGKSILIASGIPERLVEEKIGRIEAYFESIRQENAMTEEEQKEHDIDFLIGVLGDKDDVRHFCEKHDGKVFTDEEWLQKCTDVDYMLQVFDKIPELGIKRENIQEALNTIFLNDPSITADDNYGGMGM